MVNIENPTADTAAVDLGDLCGALLAKNMRPLWKETKRLNTPTPMPRTVPWIWHWDDIGPLAERAGAEVPVERGGDRRVLALANPGLDGLPFSTSTLWGAMQYLGPREAAPAHRHTASAIRFVVKGEGTFTTVEGDALEMRAGDLLLTPNWHWHDHKNETDTSMAWFDGLDLPLVYGLDAVFFEEYPEWSQPIEGLNRTEVQHGGVARLDMDADRGNWRPGFSPRFRYPWAETSAYLTTLEETSAAQWVRSQYVNPVEGTPVFPTMGCEAHRILPNRQTMVRRKVGSSVYVVYSGAGRVKIAEDVFEFGQGDCFATPSWTTVEFEVDAPVDLFAITDRPALERLSLFKEEVLEQPGLTTSSEHADRVSRSD